MASIEEEESVANSIGLKNGTFNPKFFATSAISAESVLTNKFSLKYELRAASIVY